MTVTRYWIDYWGEPLHCSSLAVGSGLLCIIAQMVSEACVVCVVCFAGVVGMVCVAYLVYMVYEKHRVNDGDVVPGGDDGSLTTNTCSS